MQQLLILLVGMGIFLFITLLLSMNDFFSPSLIVCGIFFLSVILAIRDVVVWKVPDDIFTSKATMILLSGVFVFIATEQFIKKIVCRKNIFYDKNIIYKKNTTTFHPTKVKSAIMLIIVSLFTLIYCYKMYTLALANGYNGTFNLTAIATFRHNITFDISKSYNIPRWIRMTKYVIDAHIYICIYLFIRNIIYAKDKLKNNIIYILVVLISLPTSIINSSRSSFLQIIGCALLIMYVMLRRKDNWKNSQKTFLKILRWSIVLLILALFLFYFIQANGLFGRSTNRTMLDHVTMYIGAPIIHFYQFIEEPPADVQYFAQETLAGLNNLLFKLHLRDVKYSAQLEMRTICGHTGNIYTFFRRPYHDFGLIGMYFVTGFTSAVFSYFYYKKIYRRPVSVFTDKTLIIYSYFFFIVYLIPIMCELCNFIYFGMLYYIAFIWLIYGFLLGGIRLKNNSIIIKKKYFQFSD